MVVAQGLIQLFRSLQRGVKPLLPLLLLIIFTLLGAVMFMLIEQPNEIYQLKKLKEEREHYREELAYRMNRIKGLPPIETYNRTVDLLLEYQKHLGVDEVDVDHLQWDIWGSIFFTVTVYTTVGYGNICPVTTTGRLMTVLYAFVGIPLALLALIALGGLFARACKRLWSIVLKTTYCMSKDMGRKFSKLELEDNKKDDGTDDLLRFPISMLIFVTVAWVFICAGLFMLWEDDWDYKTSLYFTLISFTTIGFGDVVPKQPKFMMLIGVLLLVGLALVSTMLNIIQQQIEAIAKGVKGSIDNQYQATQVEDGGEDGTAPTGMEQDSGKSIGNLVNSMPAKNRLLFKMMPASKKENLTKYYQKKSSMAIKACQTDDYLMQSLVGEAGMLRSIDDVNSLVAMCDF
uniref:Potassium channel domain-containing protein n=1 Tax=Plectus sambesii TaxID=2011161 RepID=A0A914XM01_9BILA